MHGIFKHIDECHRGGFSESSSRTASNRVFVAQSKPPGIALMACPWLTCRQRRKANLPRIAHSRSMTQIFIFHETPISTCHDRTFYRNPAVLQPRGGVASPAFRRGGPLRPADMSQTGKVSAIAPAIGSAGCVGYVRRRHQRHCQQSRRRSLPGIEVRRSPARSRLNGPPSCYRPYRDRSFPEIRIPSMERIRLFCRKSSFPTKPPKSK